MMSTSSTLTEDKYIEYRPGNLNLIISVPHGGTLRPDSIPDRDAGCYKDGQVIVNNCSIFIADLKYIFRENMLSHGLKKHYGF